MMQIAKIFQKNHKFLKVKLSPSKLASFPLSLRLPATSAANIEAARATAAPIAMIFFIRKNPPFYSEKKACFLGKIDYNFLLYFLERDVMI